MLVTLGNAPRAPQEGDAVDDLLACHVRIRRFVEVAARLAGGPEAQLAEAAAAVHRYFSVALPLHAEDEDLSLTPRLAGASREIDDTLGEMASEHRRIEELLAELLPHWSAVVSTPAPLLASGASRLGALFGPHLEREERVLFPAARTLLSPAELAALRSEIRARRARPS
jgi:hemerythrin-like domain-containing protein